MLRLLHFSDVHVHVPASQVPLRDWVGKRIVGGANMLLRRRRLFRNTRPKLAALARFVDRERVDVSVCTGDYTGLGTMPELEQARRTLAPLIRDPSRFVTVPGNHDLYLDDAIAEQRFERVFGDLLKSDWPETPAGPYPAVRLFEDHLAVVTVNSARPNPPVFRSSGLVPAAQLEALGQFLRDPRLNGRTIFIATHYAPRRPDGTPDHFGHGLENADALLEVGAGAPRTAILHGHIHHRFHLHPRAMPHLFGAGSATHEGREGAWLFELEPGSARAFAVRYEGDNYFREDRPSVVF